VWATELLDSVAATPLLTFELSTAARPATLPTTVFGDAARLVLDGLGEWDNVRVAVLETAACDGDLLTVAPPVLVVVAVAAGDLDLDTCAAAGDGVLVGLFGAVDADVEGFRLGVRVEVAE
jgi:hypothetical protein